VGVWRLCFGPIRDGLFVVVRCFNRIFNVLQRFLSYFFVSRYICTKLKTILLLIVQRPPTCYFLPTTGDQRGAVEVRAHGGGHRGRQGRQRAPAQVSHVVWIL